MKMKLDKLRVGMPVLFGSLAVALSAGVTAQPLPLSIGWTESDDKDNSYAIAARCLTHHIDELAPGEFEPKYYPNHQLGNELEMLQQMQMGALDAGVITATQVANIVPSFQINDLPYLYDNEEIAYKILDGDVGKHLIADAEAESLVGLGFTEGGFRNVINNKNPIHVLEDLQSVKLRVQPSDIFIDSFKALGANPAPIPFSDAFSALQQGTVDGVELPVAGIYTNRFYEAGKYLSLTKHAYNAQLLVISKSFFDTLDENIKDAIKEAGSKAVTCQREKMAHLTNELLEKMKEAGVEVNSIDQAEVQKFRDKAQPVYEKYRNTIGGDLIDQALAEYKK